MKRIIAASVASTFIRDSVCADRNTCVHFVATAFPNSGSESHNDLGPGQRHAQG
jgi:hypothetical protein